MSGDAENGYLTVDSVSRQNGDDPAVSFSATVIFH